MDKLFRVEVITKTPNPQQVIYAALRQDYAEGFIFDEIDNFPDEEECGHRCVKLLLAGNRGHFGPLEHPQITLNCGSFPHSTMQQLRTHRVGVSFDVQCLSGSSVITFVDINGSSNPKLKKTIAELYDLWHNGESAVRQRKIKGRNGEPPGKYRRDCKKRIRNMRVRSLDEASNTFTTNHIEDIVYNGLNPVYKVTLEDGKVLECTQNHQIYTPYGWRILAQLSVGSEVMVNGHPLKDADTTYQNKQWLQERFDKGLRPKHLAAIAGCSTEAIKKWAYFHGLTWQKAKWNKGATYTLNLSDAERQKRGIRAKRITKERFVAGLVPKGENHPSWKNLPVEKRAYNWLKYNREQILDMYGRKCCECGATEKLHCHHKQPVTTYPELAFDFDNFEILCASCHNRHHKMGGNNPLCSHPAKIVAIEYKGVEATYDLVMKAPHHNFVANGVVVHNSFRYTGRRIYEAGKVFKESGNLEKIEETFYLRPIGEYMDRDGGRYEYDEDWRNEDLIFAGNAAVKYFTDVSLGKSEEHARGLIPFDVRQHWVLSANTRSLMHLLTIRGKKDAQLEVQQLCELVLPHFEAWMPEIYQWFMDNQWLKGRLAP